MSIQSVSSKIESFWLSNGVTPQKTEKGYYMFVIQKWKLYMYPDDLGATFMVIPTSKKYNIKRNLKINTELGMMEVDSNPNRSNPALLYSISEDILTNSFIDKTINYMINLVNNHFDKFEKD